LIFSFYWSWRGRATRTIQAIDYSTREVTFTVALPAGHAGDHHSGLRHGHGAMTIEGGDKYDGDWLGDLRHGAGGREQDTKVCAGAAEASKRRPGGGASKASRRRLHFRVRTKQFCTSQQRGAIWRVTPSRRRPPVPTPRNPADPSARARARVHEPLPGVPAFLGGPPVRYDSAASLRPTASSLAAAALAEQSGGMYALQHWLYALQESWSWK
jgi:hypothetical protein